MNNQREWLEGMNDLSFEFNSPMTKEDWDKLQDNEMEDTVEVTFKTPSGKRVPFRKVKHGYWIKNENGTYSCSVCHSCIPKEQYYYDAQYCLHCGADMRERKETK